MEFETILHRAYWSEFKEEIIVEISKTTKKDHQRSRCVQRRKLYCSPQEKKVAKMMYVADLC